MDLTVLRRTAAHIAAAAVYELYPDIELLGGGETSRGFTYEFHFPHPVHTEIIEEKMRSIVQERRPIKTLEMVPVSAKEYLKSFGHCQRAAEVDEDHLAELIQIGSFVDLSSGPHLKNTFDLAAFAIRAEAIDQQTMRIEGWCHFSKKELRQFLKVLKNYISPEQKGEKLRYWKGNVWLKEGIELKQKLIRFLKKNLFAQAYEIEAPFAKDRNELHRSMGHPIIGEVIQFPSGKTEIQMSFFNKPSSELKSCLQMIGKTLNILGFDHSTVSSGSWTDYIVADELGISQTLVRLKRADKKKSSINDFTVQVMVDSLLSQMIEKNLTMVEFEN